MLDRNVQHELAVTTGRLVREFVVSVVKPILARLIALEHRTASMASSERIVELQTRMAELEKRLSFHDQRYDAHSRHLRALEDKFGKKLNGER